VFEQHNSIMLLIDPASGAIVDANKAASRFYGYSPEHLRNLNYWPNQYHVTRAG